VDVVADVEDSTGLPASGGFRRKAASWTARRLSNGGGSGFAMLGGRGGIILQVSYRKV